MSTNVANLLYLITIVTFILALALPLEPGDGAPRQPDRRRRHGRSRSSSRWVKIGADELVGDRGRDAPRRRLRRGRGAQGEDDRDAADGGAVQRRRRRRGGAHRARGVPPHPSRAGPADRRHRSLAIALSGLIGAISFSGSMIAFAKLQELIGGRPITYPGQKIVNLVAARRAASARRRRAHHRRPGRMAAVGRRSAAALALRRPLRAPDRRRRHAGRHLAAERVHRASRSRSAASSSRTTCSSSPACSSARPARC